MAAHRDSVGRGVAAESSSCTFWRPSDHRLDPRGFGQQKYTPMPPPRRRPPQPYKPCQTPKIYTATAERVLGRPVLGLFFAVRAARELPSPSQFSVERAESVRAFRVTAAEMSRLFLTLVVAPPRMSMRPRAVIGFPPWPSYARHAPLPSRALLGPLIAQSLDNVKVSSHKHRGLQVSAT